MQEALHGMNCLVYCLVYCLVIVLWMSCIVLCSGCATLAQPSQHQPRRGEGRTEEGSGGDRAVNCRHMCTQADRVEPSSGTRGFEVLALPSLALVTKTETHPDTEADRLQDSLAR